MPRQRAHIGIHEGVVLVKGEVVCPWPGCLLSTVNGVGGRGLLHTPGCGVRRFGAWASIRSAPAERRVVCVERCGHSGFGWAQSLTRPAPVVGSCR